MRPSLAASALATALMILPLAAVAVPVTVDFSISGSNVKGQGYFTYDSASFQDADSNGKVSSTALLSDFSATLNGASFDESTVESGYLIFAPDGSLKSFIVGDDCSAGSCTVASATPSFLIQSRSPPTTFHASFSAGQGTKQDNGIWSVRATTPVPEAASGVLLLVGLLGLGCAARLRRCGP